MKLHTSVFAKALAAVVIAAGCLPAQAIIVISEVNPTGSSASYAADWFELTNTGDSAVDITGWKMDDNSNSFASAVALRGVTSIAAGQSVVFVEGNATGTTDAAIQANFTNAWFGTNIPTGFTIGAYGGSGVGLSSGGDAVNLFDSTGTSIASVNFGTSTTGFSFDNAVGLNNATLSTLSAVGANGAFASFSSSEIGSPGAIAVPEPSSILLVAAGVALLGLRRRLA